MKIEFNRTGMERKVLVKAMGEILEATPKYLGMPTMAYKVGGYIINKDGNVEFDDGVDSKEIGTLLEQLAKRGFTTAPKETVIAAPEKESAHDMDEADTAPQGGNVGLTVAVPLADVVVGNLTKLLDAKGSLIKKALGIDALPVEVDEEKVSFPWFSEMPTADEVQAYTHFISALCEMSRNAKRVTATEKLVENEKYAFRCFLLRLGFIGAEYKVERKILLRNLSGSSAFKSGERREEVEHEISE